MSSSGSDARETDVVELSRSAARHVWHHATQVAAYAETGPLMLVEGRGATVTDGFGREYIDGTAILGVTQIGHGRKDMAEVIAAQVQKLEYASLANGFSHVPATELALRLADLTPGSLQASYFACSGSEANDTAIKMARQYHARRGNPSRVKIIGRRNSYHGVTMGAVSATGMQPLRQAAAPLVPGFSHIVEPYVYRSQSVLGCDASEVGERAAAALEAEILWQGPETVAAFIGEPIQLPQTIKVPPADYWPRIQEICRRYGVLLITDEVFNGFGRTGKWFASEHFGIEPDILVVSKGLTSGYLPLSAAIATAEVYDAFWGGPADAFAHAGTYSGHPVACAAALKNLDIIEDEQLVDRSARMGERLRHGLEQLRDRPLVGNVSGEGLMLSVELVSDQETKQPLPNEIGTFIKDRMQELGVLGRFLPNSLYYYPPLVITEEQVDRLIEVTAQALDDAGERIQGSRVAAPR
jgi:adenosylmethionine-8-amino-7-oxononanoate aminotransferase